MKEFQQKKKKGSLRPKLMIAGMALVILLLIRGNWSLYQKEKESSENAARAQAELNDLMQRQQSLQDETTRLQSSSGVEEEIRDKFQVAKDGENIMVIVDKPEDTPTSTATTSWWGSFWQKVTGVFKK